MATVYEIEQSIFLWAPKETAMRGDNVGHLVGEPNKEVSKVLVALDITPDVVREAVSNGFDLIVSHHPVMNSNWTPVQSVRSDDQQGSMLMDMIRGNVSAICMHTNLDAAVGGVNDVLASCLNLCDTALVEGGEGIVRSGTLKSEIPLQNFLQNVKSSLKANGLRYVDGGKVVRRVAVGGGACGEFFRAAAADGCDTFVTSDVKYNQFLDAKELGLNLIDAGHYPTEDCVCPAIVSYLQKQFPDLTIEKSVSHREIIQYYI